MSARKDSNEASLDAGLPVEGGKVQPAESALLSANRKLE